MAANANMCCRLFVTHGNVTYYRKVLSRCVNVNIHRLYSGATHKENELALGHSTSTASNFSSSPKTRLTQVIHTLVTINTLELKSILISYHWYY